ncbi:MAG: hypothetical protein A3H35_13395 [Betaproteobacteria bacterium RIFCSPLOWO2_02_FULL_62_17]|nr:MAG: hypothetical protein A3H35_13395 [Betaproteobacteria bacterium RIFCSPLOWO2_02_FULL_62_17]
MAKEKIIQFFPLRASMLTVAAASWLAAGTALGVDAVNGKNLFNNGPPGLGFGCAACHGSPPSAPATNGANNPTLIANKIANPGTSGMNVFAGRLSSADIADIAAYIANPSAANQPPPDTLAPTVPGGLAATAASATRIDLAWNAATDNVAVTQYLIYRSGALIATLDNVTSYINTGLFTATGYSYTVQACDAAGNCSAQSAAASATTPASNPCVCDPSILASGFNLLGNSTSTTLNVMSIFGNQTSPVGGITDNIASVWKWDATNLKWQFHSPLLTTAANATYAASHNYDVLTGIAPGEGYWVNALTAMNLPPPTGSAFNWNGFSFASLPSGFNLIAHGSNVTPSQFNANISATPPAVGVVATDNFASLWAWDATNVTWYFYSPLLESSGGLAAVKNYADSHFFQHFQDFNKKIDLGVGFWVNKF